jgi:putative membrane protein
MSLQATSAVQYKALAALSASLLLLGACNKSQSGAPPPTDAANNSMATSSPPVATAEDAAAAGVGNLSAATTTTAQGFVTAAATSDMYEIQAGKLAETKAADPAVKKFAARMVHDHTATTHQLQQLLKSGSISATPPTELDERRKGMINNLESANPSDFDKTYIDQQVAAHQEAVNLFNGYASKGDNDALKTFASTTLPKLQDHLSMAKDIQSKLSK